MRNVDLPELGLVGLVLVVALYCSDGSLIK